MISLCEDSLMLKRVEIHPQDSGSIPTSSLHITARDLLVIKCEVAEIRDFIEINHYSHNINGVKIKHCFKIEYNNILVGGIIFGAMSTTAWKKFSDSENKVIELRRFVLLDNVGKNSESRVIGFCLRELKRIDPDISIVVSYADPYHDHYGTIYKASNFEYIGLSGKDNGYIDVDTGKTYHSRALRTKYKGEYKPFVKKLREKLIAGKLQSIELPAKHCFVYKLK